MTAFFNQDRWLCSYEELRDSLVTHAKERDIFDVESYFSVSDYLVRGKVTEYHHDYVTELALRMNLAGSTERRDSAEVRIVEFTIRKAILFNNSSTAYVRIRIDDHYEIWPLSNQAFKRYVAKEFFDVERVSLNDTALNNAINILQGKAIYEGMQIKLHNRVAVNEGAIYFDLSNNQWQVVKVTPQGWETVDEPPPLFRRYSHQNHAVLPQRLVDESPSDVLERILDLVNYDPDYKLLFLVLLVFSLVPDVPHPIPVVYGEQGSAKSSFFRIWKSLVDPSELQTMSFPSRNGELIQNIDHHWFSTFDNISKLKEWQSDLICRAVTGDGFSKRRLYTDDEDFIYSFKRMIGLNGINNVAEKPDLLDRSVLFRLPAIGLSKRMDEEELWRKFDELAPSLMAALFDILAKAMEIRPTVRINGNYRMADFTKWGCAIAEALGYTQDAFLQEYHRNLNHQNMEALDIDPVGIVLRHFWQTFKAAGKVPIKMTPAEVHPELEQIALSVGVSPLEKTWPKNAQSLSRKLNQLSANLRREGIDFSSIREDGERYWVFSEVDPSEYCVSCVIPSTSPGDSMNSLLSQEGILTESIEVHECIIMNDIPGHKESSLDAMTELQKFRVQSQSSQQLALETIITLLSQKSWTEGEVRDQMVSLGHSRESFDSIFPIIQKDPRVLSKGIAPIYYSLKAER